MIEALKSDEIVNKVGGRFKLTALIQKRMLESVSYTHLTLPTILRV